MDVLGAIIGSLLGAIVALIVAQFRLRLDSKLRRQQALEKGLEFLTGGRQSRSVGIGLIEALIERGDVPSDVRPAIDNVLWNQLNYVVWHGKISRRHERNNAQRLIELVQRAPNKDALTNYSKCELRAIVEKVNAAGSEAP